MGKKGKGSKKKDDEKKKKKKKKKDDTHTSKEPSVTVSNPPTAVPMKKFMVLYMASGLEFERMRQNSTPEQRKKGMDAWMKWMNANKTSIVEGGAPLGKTKGVDSNGVSNTRNEIGGYSVVQAESHDAATEDIRQRPSSSANARRMDRNPRDHAVAWDVVTNASCIAAVRSLVSVASTSALGHSRHMSDCVKKGPLYP